MKALFPRRSGQSKDSETRQRAEAHRLLDMYRAGVNVSQERVDWALRITGDLV